MITYFSGVNQKESKFSRGERFAQSLKKTNSVGIANTITTNTGNRVTDNFIIDDTDTENLKTKLCNKLIATGKVKENDVIRHSYSNSRLQDWDKRNIKQNNISPTLDTRCDCLGVVVNTNNKKLNETFLRIRKLTPLECFRLMGFDDEDYYKMSKFLSNSQLYHCMGDSIVVKVLEDIFRELIEPSNHNITIPLW